MNKRICWHLVALIIIVQLFSGCASITKPMATGYADDPVYLNLAQQKTPVYVLPVQMSFEQASTELQLPGSIEQRTSIEDVMGDIVFEGLSTAGFKVVSNSEVLLEHRASVNELTRQLSEECRVLTSSYKDKTALLPSMKELAEKTATEIICVQTVRVKVGQNAAWNPNSGAMAQGTSSTAIKIALVSLGSGEVLWENESFTRTGPNNNKFNEAVMMLFDSKNVNSGGMKR